MGASISHCVYLVGGFCGAGVYSGGLDSLNLLYHSSLLLAFFYAIMIMSLSINATGSPGGGGGGVIVAAETPPPPPPRPPPPKMWLQKPTYDLYPHISHIT